MLLSMTGYGSARYQSETLNLNVELRAVNNRYLKVTVRATEPYNRFEPEIEKLVRRCLRRGTVQVVIHAQRQLSAQDFPMNITALESYLDQVRGLCVERKLSIPDEVLLPGLLSLPGVVPEFADPAVDVTDDWPVLEQVVREAIDKLQSMRREEGRAMADELLQHREEIANRLQVIREQIPRVVESFRDRLYERVSQLLRDHDIALDQNDLIREVAVFAERCDIAEEVVRLASHLEQFKELIEASSRESPGRKLEFVTQEILREANTIGSKASDIEITRQTVEIKGALEKIRELVQNIE
ncbi:MAG: hypothetical protein KatS3mg105_3669 [Gemmatales bacterium]|nr:MAG: hypothetical protein KatS3mg105_3669 [Gemmatales bacterium]